MLKPYYYLCIKQRDLPILCFRCNSESTADAIFAKYRTEYFYKDDSPFEYSVILPVSCIIPTILHSFVLQQQLHESLSIYYNCDYRSSIVTK